jgi:hypothetical protein
MMSHKSPVIIEVVGVDGRHPMIAKGSQVQTYSYQNGRIGRGTVRIYHPREGDGSYAPGSSPEGYTVEHAPDNWAFYQPAALTTDMTAKWDRTRWVSSR